MNTQETFARIVCGQMTTEEIKEVLTAYHEKGVTADDLMAAASAMRPRLSSGFIELTSSDMHSAPK